VITPVEMEMLGIPQQVMLRSTSEIRHRRHHHRFRPTAPTSTGRANRSAERLAAVAWAICRPA
jgi:hypothetical protein